MSTVALPVLAVLAGLVSITSPCCLPLIPSYVSYVSSLPVGELPQADARRLALQSSLLFVAGFTIVFTILGLTASVVGTALLRNLPAITRVAGVFILAMGLAALGVIPRGWLQRELRLDPHRLPRGRLGALPLGMAFAAGWTPCIGPVLAAILALAASSGSALGGGALLALYSMGLGVPFVAIAVGYQRLGRSLGWLRRHGRAIERAGGVLLVVVGLGYVSGQWVALFRPLQRWFAGLGWPPI
ncbi:MAG: cytochrome C biogenesis protein [Acidimicrobiales bacterium]|uniref:Cytochrome C biogenesis protein n=1 Tax=Candidatus Aeolococcus gillhamiae TaxID=3127015 RepID=A0A2W6ALM1_9BACT|nr:MAG: cytochrome C biogenesis protein [Candidatus Dormibacter sp. RRmetagenome_bin12]PZS17489.1 MAG: cytochrome C biogenesis protein [Acidimicrobiales bacterium]